MSSASNKIDPQKVPCKKRNSSRRRYLPSYSQVNLQKFSFSNVVLKAFKKYSKSKASVTKWEKSAWRTIVVVANTFPWLWNWAAHLDDVQFLSICAVKRTLYLIPPQVIGTILQYTDINVKKNHWDCTTQPRPPKPERC